MRYGLNNLHFSIETTLKGVQIGKSNGVNRSKQHLHQSLFYNFVVFNVYLASYIRVFFDLHD